MKSGSTASSVCPPGTRQLCQIEGPGLAHVLAPRALLDRVEKGRRLSRGGEDRHSNLDAMLTWSWDELEPDARAALARCAVFCGDFDLAAAEAVLGEDALDPLLKLEEQSLLRVEHHEGAPRFRLLAIVRRFALQQLREEGAAHDAFRAHGEHYLHIGEALAASVEGPGAAAALHRLFLEQENLIAIHEREAGRYPERAVRAMALEGVSKTYFNYLAAVRRDSGLRTHFFFLKRDTHTGTRTDKL